MKRILLMLFLGMLLVVSGIAQTINTPKKSKNQLPPKAGYSWSGHEQLITIPRNITPGALDTMIRQFGLEDLKLRFLLDSGQLQSSAAALGWRLTTYNDLFIQVSKSLDKFEGDFDFADKMRLFENVFLEAYDLHTFTPQAVYGVNKFRYPATTTGDDGTTRFFLKGHSEAGSVFLSGSFNAWQKSDLAMDKTADGWALTIRIPEGKHLYKFIVDGKWINDPANELKEDDLYSGYNSIYFCYNYTFRLRNTFENARKVILAGSFNNWNEKELEMKLVGNEWVLPLYLQDGTHAYKFIVDKQWMLDPANPVVRIGEGGHENSYISLGDTTVFFLEGFLHAKQVILCGEFNNWNEQELAMTKNDMGWIFPYVLREGSFQYKFIVDGNWIADPGNPLSIGEPPFNNSVVQVGSNHEFRLKGYEKAEKVVLSGTFNGWNENDYRMQREGGDWVFSIYLPYGKHYYKFIVDGVWLKDPDNPLWEENEHNTGNSIVWRLPEQLLMATPVPNK